MCSCVGNSGIAGRIYGRGVPSPVSGWDIWVCIQCRSGFYDGVPLQHPFGLRLVRHLKACAIDVRLNSHAHIAIPGNQATGMFRALSKRSLVIPAEAKRRAGTQGFAHAKFRDDNRMVRSKPGEL
jgi:hypothetical protein